MLSSLNVIGEGRILIGYLVKLFLLKIAHFSFDEIYKRLVVLSLILKRAVSTVNYG
jgi:hypothetical protein